MKRYFCFADISNFTSTTEIFINQSKYGAEKVRDLVDSIFSKSTDYIYRKNGQVLLFAGDGLLFYLNDEESVTALHERMRRDAVSYNSQHGTELDVKMLRFKDEMRAQIISAGGGEFVYFHPEKSGADAEVVRDKLNMSFIKQLERYRGETHPGELRTLPVSFLHIDGRMKPSDLNPYFKRIIERSLKCGVYVNKIEWADKGWMVLLSCGAPYPAENAPMAMMDFLSYSASEAEKEGFRIHAGSTLKKGYSGIIGTEDRWEYTFFGANVNLAARMAHSAPAGAIVCDSGYLKETAGEADFEFLENRRFKGISGETETFLYRGRTFKDENDIFIGREKESKVLGRHMKGSLKASVMEGEAGIGKSSILKNFMKLNRNIMYVKAVAGSGPMKLIENINREFALNIPGIKGKDEREKFIKYCFTPVQALFTLIIDDAQYADEESLEVIRYIFMEGCRGVNFVFSARNSNLYEFTDSKLSKYDVLKMKIEGMDREEIKSMLSSYGGGAPEEKDVDALLKISGGNPLYAVQMINYMQRENILKNEDGRLTTGKDIAAFPYSLQELLFMKIDGLDRNERDVIEIGAVRGNEFENRLIEEAVQDVESDIRDLLKKSYEMKILSRKAERVTVFYHSLVRQSVYDRMLRKRIESIARRIADIFAADNNNPESLRTAGDFYLMRGDRKAAECYLNSANLFIKRKKFKKASFSLEKYFRCPFIPDSLDDACIPAYTMITSHPERSLIYAVYEKLTGHKKQTYNSLMCLSECCQSLFWKYRDVKACKKIVEIMKRSRSEETEFEVLMAESSYLRAIDCSKNAFKIYEGILRRKSTSGEQRFKTLLSVLSLVFFEFSSLKLTEKYMKEADRAASKIKDEELLLDYYTIKYSIEMHRNKMDISLKHLKKAFQIAKKLSKTDEIAGMYNDFSIIYAIEGQKKEDTALIRRSVAYSIKSYKMMKKLMRMNNLPLITTNIGSKYMSSGDVRKAMKYYYEGLLYGTEVDHPVEVPYTRSLIAQLMFDAGNRRCVISECDSIINHRVLTDILPAASILKYLSAGGYENKRRALNKARSFLNQGLTQPTVTVLCNLFDDAFVRDDLKGMVKYSKEIEKFIKEARLRDNILTSLKVRLLYRNILSGSKEDAYELARISEMMTRLELKNKVLAIALCGTGESLLKEGCKDGMKYLKKAYSIAKHMKYPQLMKKILHKMESFSTETGFISKERRLAEAMEIKSAEAATIEEFAEYIYKY